MNKKTWTEDDLKLGMVFYSDKPGWLPYAYKLKNIEPNRQWSVEYIDIRGITTKYLAGDILKYINEGYDIYLPMHDTKLGRHLYNIQFRNSNEANTTKD